jgi:hypothetical protein
MAAPTSQPAAIPERLLALPTAIDTWSKGIAGAAIALYASGYLIISLHHSKFGFTETNPFRPKILSAGAWFFFLSAIPVVLVTNYTREEPRSWLRFAQFLYPYYVVCVSLSIVPLAFTVLNAPAAASFPSWWKVLIGLILFGLLIFLINWKKIPPLLSAGASVAFIILALQSVVRDLIIAQRFDFGSIILWFFGVGVVTWLEMNTRSRETLVQGDWAKVVFTALGVLFVFATFFYPHIKASWGGGSLVPVTIYFSKDSALKPNQSASVLLIDESDAGFYIVSGNDAKAIFVPRNSVSMIYFSDKVANPSVLP